MSVPAPTDFGRPIGRGVPFHLRASGARERDGFPFAVALPETSTTCPAVFGQPVAPVMAPAWASLTREDTGASTRPMQGRPCCGPGDVLVGGALPCECNNNSQLKEAS